MRKLLLALGFFFILITFAAGFYAPNEPAFGIIGLGAIGSLFFGLGLLILSFHPKFYKSS